MRSIIVAVSGGVDSVVLLHRLAQEPSVRLVVAHFDHGIRPESDADARFVEGLARHYDLPFEQKREELGGDANEALARERRYAFLKFLAQKHDAVIATAHHRDDVIETVVINILRGTGWRGLAVLSGSVYRPLLSLTKTDIRNYALEKKLEWVEDETNAEDKYLRNRIRARIATALPFELKEKLILLWTHQVELKKSIDDEVDTLLPRSDGSYSRYFFTQIDDSVALELLRPIFTDRHVSLTRPQRLRLQHAVKVAKSGSQIEVGEGVTVRFTKTSFIVETLPSVV